MSEEYWNKKHKEGWANKADLKSSLFAEYAVKYFPKSGKILELGTGKGGDAKFFGSLGYEVVATDYSKEALEIAKGHISGVELIYLDTSTGLPFPDGSFDVVYSHMALHYFDEKTTRRIFEDIQRVLKPNGIFATITNTTDDPEAKDSVFTELEPDFYRNNEMGIVKRYFSVSSMKEFTRGLFEPILLDNKGEAVYKTTLKSLVRFIGKKK